MNDPLVKKYRESFCGANCRFCKYHKYVIPTMPFCDGYEECVLKDKIIRIPFKAKFCNYYRVEEK